jgi:hypothetical protein
LAAQLLANPINDEGWIATVRLDNPNDISTDHWYLLKPVQR